ncbi:hypothetical protein [Pseudomonas sp. A34-9]|uniref:hypothetical protein n=1 Tax=Pseudomonas sp. A34-9 TaxID=3034675 RepID=UPI00240D7D08|nr:hypothetical protein [Pseudomonas sp. A34-9]
MTGIVPEKDRSLRQLLQEIGVLPQLRSFLAAHPMKQAHRVKNMRQRFIVADLRFIK